MKEYPRGQHILQARAAIKELNRLAEEERAQEKKRALEQQKKEEEERQREKKVAQERQKREAKQPAVQSELGFNWKKWTPIGGSVLVVILIIWGVSQWAAGGDDIPADTTAITKQELSQDEGQGREPMFNLTKVVTLGGRTYKTIRLNGKTWMAENLNYEVADSWCYDDKSSNCEKYGRLYSWAAAKKACAAVGWRLPTDQEWRNMAKQYGGADDDAADGGKAAYKALINKGDSGFAALLGGWRGPRGDYSYLGVRGYYWSGTEKGTQNAWGYIFLSVDGKLYRRGSVKSYGFSCRCLKD